MKTGKRFLAMLLAVLMAFSTLAVANISIASAADYTSATSFIAGITTGSLSATGAKSWYKFTASAAATQLTFTHAAKTDTTVYFTVQVFTEANAASATNPSAKIDSLATDTSTTVDLATTSGSTYYVSVETNNTAAVGLSYSMTVAATTASETESNDTAAKANTVEPGDTIRGTASSISDQDWFKITLASACYLNVTLSHSIRTGVTSKYFIVTILSSDATTRIDSFDSLGGETDKSWSDGDGVAVGAGTYYIQVVDGGALSGAEYKLTFTTAEIPDHDTESENNNSTSSANTITSGMPMLGALNVTREGVKDTDDYYKFTVTGSAIVNFSLTHSVQNKSAVFFRVKLVDSQSNELASIESVGNNGTTSSSKVYLAAGTYYVRVYRESSDTDSLISYLLLLNVATVSGAEAEPNNDITSANTIKYGTVQEAALYHASLSTEDDVDFFKVTISDRGYIYVRFYSENSTSSTIYHAQVLKLSDNAGQVSTSSIKEFDINYTDGEFASGCLGLDAGTYYIKVTPKYYDKSVQGYYGVGVQYQKYGAYEVETNDNYSTANSLIAGSTTQYILGSSFDTSDEDWFVFTLTEKKNVEFNINREYTTVEKTTGATDSTTYKWNVDVYKSTNLNSHLLSESFTSTSAIDKTLEKLEAGTYYIRVRGNASAFSKGDYKVSITIGAASSTTVWTILVNFFTQIKNIDWSNLKKMFSFISSIDWSNTFTIWYHAIQSIVILIQNIRA